MTIARADALAPRWHTAALVALLLLVAATGAWLERGGPQGVAVAAPRRAITVYLPMIAVQWGLTAYVCRLGRPRSVLRDLIGRRPCSARALLADGALAVALGLLVEASEAWFARGGPARNAAVLAILPHSPAERALWVGVAVSAGFCEEVVYRGYLQLQFTRFARSVSLAIALQAVLFGIAHGEQGLATAARFAVYGAAFGATAWWRKSLVPGIACHIAIDLASGLLSGIGLAGG